MAPIGQFRMLQYETHVHRQASSQTETQTCLYDTSVSSFRTDDSIRLYTYVSSDGGRPPPSASITAIQLRFQKAEDEKRSLEDNTIVATLNLSPDHYQTGCHSACVAPTDYHLGWDKPSTCSSGGWGPLAFPVPSTPGFAQSGTVAAADPAPEALCRPLPFHFSIGCILQSDVVTEREEPATGREEKEEEATKGKIFDDTRSVQVFCSHPGHEWLICPRCRLWQSEVTCTDCGVRVCDPCSANCWHCRTRMCLNCRPRH